MNIRVEASVSCAHPISMQGWKHVCIGYNEHGSGGGGGGARGMQLAGKIVERKATKCVWKGKAA
jgi:hypothetical protein